jgi:hypothetical protein
MLIRCSLVLLLLLLLQVILEALDTHLVVFSPYISLTKLLESDPQLADLSQNAWAALNDVYRTDAPLVYAPHVLALGCLYLASVICSRDITAWLEGVDADINEVGSLLCGSCAREGSCTGNCVCDMHSGIHALGIWIRSHEIPSWLPTAQQLDDSGRHNCTLNAAIICK